jgi:hypothetical protein
VPDDSSGGGGGGSTPGPNGPGDTCEQNAGDPIQVNYEGSQYRVFNDALIKGRLQDFRLYRSYISNLPSHGENNYSPAFKDTLLKAAHVFGGSNFIFTKEDGIPRWHEMPSSTNWKHSFSIYISTFYVRGGRVYHTLVAGNGAMHPYDCNDDVYDQTLGCYQETGFTTTRLFILRSGGNPYGYLWVDRNGNKYYFNSCATGPQPEKCTSVEGRDLEEDPFGPFDAYIDRIEDPTGKSVMTFQYFRPGEPDTRPRIRRTF